MRDLPQAGVARVAVVADLANPRPSARSTRAASFAVAWLGALLVAAAAPADTLEQGLALVPADAVGVFVVPNLKKCSDELSTCLERIDRPEAALVGRPLDLVKARLGITAGVRDDGALIGILRWPDGAAAPLATVLVAVNDAAAVLDGNFTRSGDSEVMRVGVGGRTFATKRIDTKERGAWVALSETPDGVAGLGEDAAGVARHLDRLGPKRDVLLRRADAVAWIDGAFVRAAAREATKGAAAPAVEGSSKGSTNGALGGVLDGALGADRARAVEARLAKVRDGLTVAAMAWDIDALGLLGRGLLRFDPASEIGALFVGGDEAAKPAEGSGASVAPRTARDRLARLPDQPFYWALGVDLQGLGGVKGIEALDALLVPGIASAAPWLGTARELAWGVYPSKLGVAVGGVLNDSALVLVDGDPAALRDALRARLTQVAEASDLGDGMKRELKWEANREVKGKESTDAIVADAYELVETSLPGAAPAPDAAMRALAKSILFGQRGVHGFAKPLDDALVITSSQRPDVLRRAVAAASGTGEKRLGANATVAAMREFLLPDADIEAFVGVGAIGKLVRSAMAAFGGGDAKQPELDFGPEPIGLALEVDRHDVEGAIVIPAAMVGIAVDMAKRSGAAPAPK
ncbi:MAG: hypothetical protein U0575_05745 [Phycisphaerales bacterium]